MLGARLLEASLDDRETEESGNPGIWESVFFLYFFRFHCFIFYLARFGTLATGVCTATYSLFVCLGRRCFVSQIPWDILFRPRSGWSQNTTRRSRQEHSLRTEPAHARTPTKRRTQVAAVLIVSPTYEGACADVASAAEACHGAGVPLVVDEAHGAHLAFLGEIGGEGEDKSKASESSSFPRGEETWVRERDRDR